MNVPRFWARSTADVRNKDGRSLELAAWGWSSNDRSEAEAKARERLARLRSRVEHGLELSHAKATCRVVEEVGWRRVHPDVAPILSAHDRVTKATSRLPLA